MDITAEEALAALPIITMICMGIIKIVHEYKSEKMKMLRLIEAIIGVISMVIAGIKEFKEKKQGGNKMFRKNKYQGTSIEVNTSVEGETIEDKIERIVANKEPIEEGGVELNYTDRKDGVLPEYNIRTDKFDIAIDAMNIANKTANAKREAKMEIVKKDETAETDSTSSTTSQSTDNG